MIEERRCGTTDRRVHKELCDERHQALDKLLDQKFESLATAVILKATADLVTKVEMKEYVNDRAIKWVHVIMVCGLIVAVAGAILHAWQMK
jgi:hypothetical protein